MTTSRAPGKRLYRPEPSRWWIRYVPVSWPAAPGLWTHLAERTLGSARPGEVPSVDPSTLSDVVYLPPVEAANEAAAVALVERLRAASVPVVTQCRPGEAKGHEGQVLDLLATLAERGVQALEGLVTECESAVWPLIPGLTASPEVWEQGLDLLAAAGLRVVVPQVFELDPRARRELAEFTDDDGYQALFHGSVPEERSFVRAAAARGLATRLQRPRVAATPRAEFCRRVAEELIVVADLWLKLARPEAAGQNLLRAARWAEDSEQDLRAIAREGNLGVLPWIDDNAREVVTDLAADRPSALRQALDVEYSGADL